MLAVPSLHSFFSVQNHESFTEFEHAVFQFLNEKYEVSKEILETCVWKETFFSDDKAVENWKNLLALNLLGTLSNTFQAEIAVKIGQFEQHSWSQNSQYFRVLVALNHALAKMPIPEPGVHLLESGAALIDLQEYSPWLSLPYTPQHYEFGIFLSLLTLVTKREDLKESVLRIANWQLNTLDAQGIPLIGLFSREKQGNQFQIFSLSYLFFKTVSLLSADSCYAAIADAISKKFHVFKNQKETLHPLWVLIEKWLEQFKLISNKPLLLPEQIHDTSTALVGYRSDFQHVACTLHGSHTGLGTMKHGEIEVMNYGPQYFPLEECRGFGIEGNALSDHGMRRSVMEWRPHSFCLKGCVRMVDEPIISSNDAGKYRGIWLDISQEFKKPDFYLKTTFLGLDGWDSVAFCFYVKASRCLIQSQTFLPGTLDRYEGTTQTITFESVESFLELRSLLFKGTMQIIPLAGGNNFWGANFLVAYILNSDQRHYQWHIGPQRSSQSSRDNY